MTTTKKEILTKKDFEICSLWKFCEDELYYPIYNKSDFPEDVFDLYIKAKFTLKNNEKLDGYIIGFGHVFAITIFIDEYELTLNNNLLYYAKKNIEKIGEQTQKKLTLEDFSPVKYITDFNFMDIENIEGEFDLLKPLTDEERLWQYNVEK